VTSVPIAVGFTTKAADCIEPTAGLSQVQRTVPVVPAAGVAQVLPADAAAETNAPAAGSASEVASVFGIPRPEVRGGERV
jgi:hypothetical protein